MGRQIMVSDELYDQLNDLRKHRGHKYSFNTVIKALLREALVHTTNEEVYRKLQWHGIQKMFKDGERDGWIPHYLLQYSHVTRMLVNRQYEEAIEYIRGQFPVETKLPLEHES